MHCPRCQQTTTYDQNGRLCVLCGFPLREAQRRMNLIYLLTSALFGSTLLYGIVVYVLETMVKLPPPPALPVVLPYVLLVVAVLCFGLGVSFGRRGLERATTPIALQRTLIIELALFEAIALLGLGLYLLTHSLLWFTTFLGLSWLAFLWVGSQSPQLARLVSQLMIVELKQQADEGPREGN
jgi:hypothetical protein